MSTRSEDEILRFTKEIIVAHVSHNVVDSDTLPALIRSVHQSLVEARDALLPLDTAKTAAGDPSGGASDAGSDGPGIDGQAAPRLVPAVPISESVTPDHIICLEDGRPFKMMKRWLRATYGMTPEQYRAKWGLPPDYPMVAPSYAQSKSVYAKNQGLGTKGLRHHDEKRRSRRSA
jgi:predicted transcriptional regulator